MHSLMEKNNAVSKVFLAGIVCSALTFSNQILDPTLTPRVISFSFFSVAAIWLMLIDCVKAALLQ